MRNVSLILVACVFSASCEKTITPIDPERIVAMERAALDRWGKGDPQGYLETYAPEITYFDPAREKRADGIQAMQEYYRPITGKIKMERYEMIDPKVQPLSDAAVLSYQLNSYAVMADGSRATVRWNSTKVYKRIGNDWKLIHDHWSYIKPELNSVSGPQ